MQTFALMGELPLVRMEKILEALKQGASIRQAAACASLTVDEIEMLIYWGIEGLEPWEELVEQILRVQGEVRVRPMMRLYQKAQDGDMIAFEKWQKMCDEAEAELAFPSGDRDGGSKGGMNLTLNVQRSFEPGEGYERLPPGEIVDAEYEEN